MDNKIRSGSRVVVAALVPAKGDEDAPMIAAAVADVEAAGGIVVGTLVQRRGVSRAKKPGGSAQFEFPMNAATYLGSGKVQELAELVKSAQADMVVICNALSGTQRRNIEEMTGVPVAIFASPRPSIDL